ncbi:MAG: LacI family DNA-binding transcriptional regulator [Rhodospirillaceae bacterium]|jgi:LacI family transcriptional regulator|nr:LacI family DNA-binding transcriptional regulator [Rhodospirillaceae bacterium]
MTQVRVTLRDIAHQAGVHPSTVSRVLNHGEHGLISADVVKRVTDMAAELGYTPNWSAYQLRTNRSHTVAVMVTDITNHMNLQIVRGIEDRLLEAGLTPMICSTEQRPERIDSITAMMRSGQFDGMILSTAEPNDPIISACQRTGLPFVVVGRNEAPPGMPTVIIDETHGTDLVIKHLADLGHRDLALIVGGQNLTAGQIRHQCFMEAVEAHGLTVDPAHIIFSNDYTIDGGRVCCERLLDNGVDVTAIIAVNDLVAMGCYQACTARGIKCPDDVSITGYNEIRYSALVSPSLTTVRARSLDAGVALADILIECIENPGVPARQEVVLPELIIRESTGPVRA